MADGYDRFENEGGGGGSFVMGLLTGTVLGAGLGMLFAPKAGSDTRQQLSEQANTLANTASQGYRRASETATDLAGRGRETAVDFASRSRETATDLANRGLETATDLASKGLDAYDKARDAVSRGAEEAQRYVRDVSADVNGESAPGTFGNDGSGTAAAGSSSSDAPGSRSFRPGPSGTT
jgi:gas vesicle protein